MKVITVASQKGGVGKSTTAEALMAGLSLRGYKVLAVDMDAQRNLTYTTKADAHTPTVLEVLTGDAKIQDAIVHTERGDVLPASNGLAGADAFITKTGKEYRLREALEKLGDAYDFVLVDTPPALGILTVNALTATDYLIAPAQADIYSLQGIQQLVETMEPVRKYCNSALRITGILLTRYSPRSILSRDVAGAAEEMAQQLGTKVFKTTIREAVVVKEAQISQETLFDYAPKANVTADYTALIDELLTEVAG